MAGRTISGAVTDRNDFRKLSELVADYVARAHAAATGAQSCATPEQTGKKPA